MGGAGKKRRRDKKKYGAATDILGDDDDHMDIGKQRTPEELETMSVISQMRSKANNKPRHRPEFQAARGVNVNGAKVFSSVANLAPVRKRAVVKKKADQRKRTEKALAAQDKFESRLEKDLGRKTVKQRLKHLWE